MITKGLAEVWRKNIDADLISKILESVAFFISIRSRAMKVEKGLKLKFLNEKAQGEKTLGILKI